MSHSQFHSTSRLYLDMHGLIFETSVCYWQNQPGCYLLTKKSNFELESVTLSAFNDTQTSRLELFFSFFCFEHHKNTGLCGCGESEDFDCWKTSLLQRDQPNKSNTLSCQSFGHFSQLEPRGCIVHFQEHYYSFQKRCEN